MPYTPSIVQQDAENFNQYVLAELDRISEYTQNLEDGFLFVRQRSEPRRPRDFQVVLADGSGWDPLSLGRPHLVVYHAGQWHAVK